MTSGILAADPVLVSVVVGRPCPRIARNNPSQSYRDILPCAWVLTSSFAVTTAMWWGSKSRLNETLLKSILPMGRQKKKKRKGKGTSATATAGGLLDHLSSALFR
jgi:hypothetical protein